MKFYFEIYPQKKFIGHNLALPVPCISESFIEIFIFTLVCAASIGFMKAFLFVRDQYEKG